MPTYTPAQIAQEVLNQGGSKAQAWVAAALVDGIESSGDTGAKNPSSTACGLFQFLTTTWASNGGTKYAPTACQASMQNQVTVFLTASAGSNFYPWAPDLGGAYNGNGKQPAATTPQPGSPVANMIAKLSSGGTMAFLGNVPTNWADAGAANPAAPTPPGTGSASPAATTSGLSTCVVQLPGFLFLSGPCLLTKGGVKWLSGVAALVTGAGLFTFGTVMLAAYGYDKSGAKQAVGSTARKIGIGTSLLAGQPEVAAGIAATGGQGRSTSQQPSRARSAGPNVSRGTSVYRSTLGTGAHEPRQSLDIDREFAEMQRQSGPIGSRGGSATSQRIAAQQRRGRSVPLQGGGRPRTPEQRARAVQRARQPF